MPPFSFSTRQPSDGQPSDDDVPDWAAILAELVPPEFRPFLIMLIAGSTVLLVVAVLTSCCCCLWRCSQPCIYWLSMTKERPSGQLGRYVQPGMQHADFDSPKFGCLDDMGYCCVSLCFLPCRQADTISVLGNNEGLMNWWIAFVLVEVAGVLGYWCSYTKYPLSFLFAYWGLRTLVFAKLRSQLRGAIGRRPFMELEDCLFWCYCCFCATVQEAKEADKATGTRMECCGLCCPKLVLTPNPTNMVGAPALVAAPGVQPVAAVQPVQVTVNLQDYQAQPQASAPPVYG